MLSFKLPAAYLDALCRNMLYNGLTKSSERIVDLETSFVIETTLCSIVCLYFLFNDLIVI